MAYNRYSSQQSPVMTAAGIQDLIMLIAEIKTMLIDLKKALDEQDEKIECLLDEVVGPEDTEDPDAPDQDRNQIMDHGGLASQMLSSLQKPF